MAATFGGYILKTNHLGDLVKMHVAGFSLHLMVLYLSRLPQSINAQCQNQNQNLGIDPKCLSMPLNADQFRSIPLNADQCRIKASVKHY